MRWLAGEAISDASNSLLLQIGAHRDFNKYQWGLKEIPNKIGRYEAVSIAPGPPRLPSKPPIEDTVF